MFKGTSTSTTFSKDTRKSVKATTQANLHPPPQPHALASASAGKKGGCGAHQTPQMGPSPLVLPHYTSPTKSHRCALCSYHSRWPSRSRTLFSRTPFPPILPKSVHFLDEVPVKSRDRELQGPAFSFGAKLVFGRVMEVTDGAESVMWLISPQPQSSVRMQSQS